MKISKLILSIVVLIIFSMTCFSQVKEKDKKNKSKEFKEGYKSALEFLVPPDPRTYSHTHTGSLQRSADGLSVESGTVAFIEASSMTDPNHQHTVKYYLPFINTKGLTEKELLSVKIDAPANNLTLSCKFRTIDIPDNTGAPSGVKVMIAYDLEIK